jgi:hypothetical protein
MIAAPMPILWAAEAGLRLRCDQENLLSLLPRRANSSSAAKITARAQVSFHVKHFGKSLRAGNEPEHAS